MGISRRPTWLFDAAVGAEQARPGGDLHGRDAEHRVGHLAGDDCLKKVAAAIRNQVRRPADFLARYGGEEFVCLLPEGELSGAQIVAEKIRQSIEALAIEHRNSASGTQVTVTLDVR